MSIRLYFPAAVLCCLFLGCPPDDGGFGPCVHIYKEPVLNIQSITNAQTGQSVIAFEVLQAYREGVKVDLPSLAAHSSLNVVVFDSTLYCGLPSGFGVEPGTYLLTITARGCRDTTIALTASYAVNKGGCPSSSDGGSRHSFQMQSQ